MYKIIYYVKNINKLLTLIYVPIYTYNHLFICLIIKNINKKYIIKNAFKQK